MRTYDEHHLGGLIVRTVEHGGPKQQNQTLQRIDSVNYALMEIVRYREKLSNLIKNANSHQDPDGDLLFHVNSKKFGYMPYGQSAELKLKEITKKYLKAKNASSYININNMLFFLKKAIVRDFIDGEKEVNTSNIDKAFSSAFKAATDNLSRTTFYIPCRLMQIADPEKFEIGPVKFCSLVTFEVNTREIIERQNEFDENRKFISISDRVLKYYRNFDWIAEITIEKCDAESSEERSIWAAESALNFLHIALGHHHTRKMTIKGSANKYEPEGSISIKDGEANISYSEPTTSALGFQNGWADIFNEPGWDNWFSKAGKIIESITNPSSANSISLKFLGAASWYGQAVREASPAASIVKAVSALEHLVTAGENIDVGRIVAERSASLRYDPADGPKLDDIIDEMKSVYDLRSRLVHGDISPFDPEIRERRAQALYCVEQTLLNGLVFFCETTLLDNPPTEKKLKKAFENMVASTRSLSNQI